MLNRTVVVTLLAGATACVHAQWLHYPDPRPPRTKDGKPNLISFQFENGVYIAPKIIDTGYLAIGKKKLPFARRVAANRGASDESTEPTR